MSEKLEKKKKEKAEEILSNKFGNPMFTAYAPGRINLIGGHTDYNEGFVLPVAIDREIVISALPNNTRRIRAYSLEMDDKTSFSLDKITHNKKHPWVDYLAGVAKMFQNEGMELRGMDLAIVSNIPIGYGLSSSAALESATAYALQKINGYKLEGKRVANLCKKAENEFLGVSCGIMDQFTSILAKKNKILFIDCQTKEYDLIPFKTKGIKIVVANTKVKRELSNSIYNQRVKECQECVKRFNKILNEKKSSLRDISPKQFENYKDELPDVLRERGKHVIYENERVKKAAEAMKREDNQKVGKLMIQSHKSLRDLYEVSCKELNLMFKLALEIDETLGARMTGAGFGGCTVNLVREEGLEKFRKKVKKKYKKKTGIEPEIYVCSTQDGAHLLNQFEK